MKKEEKRAENPLCAMPLWVAAARGISLFLGLFTLWNLLGEWFVRGFDANIWWVDLRWLPRAVSLPLLYAASFLLTAFGLRPRYGSLRRVLSLGAAILLFCATIENSVTFYSLLAKKTISSDVPVPLSLVVALALLYVLLAMARVRAGSSPPSRLHTWAAAATMAFCCVAFPLLQMFCFGKTDYRRPADAAVVFGARAYASGRLSDALSDRVRTACALYLEGLVPKLVFSGGPGDGKIHETEAMRRFAESLGVKTDDIILDVDGLSTDATVRNTVPLFRREGFQRVLAVSHFYHLPRVKMRYQREGCEVFTVPAQERYTLLSAGLRINFSELQFKLLKPRSHFPGHVTGEGPHVAAVIALWQSGAV